MKKILFATLLLAGVSFSMDSFAQFRVNSNGTAQITVANSAAPTLTAVGKYKGINGHATGNASGWAYGVQGFANYNSAKAVGVFGETSAPGAGDNNFRGYGVMGVAYNAQSGCNYGVFGRVYGNNFTTTDYYCGAAIYGTADPNDSEGQVLDDSYAGYFRGKVLITGQTFLYGSIYGLLSPDEPTSTYSDEEETSITDRLSQVRTFSHYLDPSSIKGQQTNIDMKEMAKKHYSISAEDFMKAFPELVHEAKNGEQYIDYKELVNILLQAVNELKSEVKEVRAQSAHYSRKLTGIELPLNERFTLKQNNPNPWTISTEIAMYIPEKTSKAFLNIYDLTGKEVKSIPVDGREQVTVSLKSYDFAPGIYIYTLLADGKVMDSKRMILTK